MQPLISYSWKQTGRQTHTYMHTHMQSALPYLWCGYAMHTHMQSALPYLWCGYASKCNYLQYICLAISTLLLHLVLATLPIEFLTFKISNPVHSGGRSSVGHAIKAPPPMGPSFVRTPPQLNSLSQFLFCFVFRFFPLLV